MNRINFTRSTQHLILAVFETHYLRFKVNKKYTWTFKLALYHELFCMYPVFWISKHLHHGGTFDATFLV